MTAGLASDGAMTVTATAVILRRGSSGKHLAHFGRRHYSGYTGIIVATQFGRTRGARTLSLFLHHGSSTLITQALISRHTPRGAFSVSAVEISDSGRFNNATWSGRELARGHAPGGAVKSICVDAPDQ